MKRAGQGDLRTRLLRAAETEIATSGLARASLRAIARRCGVSHQATAHHFDDRAGLFTALALEGARLMHEKTLEAIAGAPVEGGAQVAAAGAAYVDFARRHATLFDVMHRRELINADDPELLAALMAQRDLIVATIAAAQATGWGARVPADELAALSWATVHGLAILEREGMFAVAYPDVDLSTSLQRVTHALDALT